LEKIQKEIQWAIKIEQIATVETEEMNEQRE